MAAVTLVLEGQDAQLVQSILRVVNTQKQMETGIKSIGSASATMEKQVVGSYSKIDASVRQGMREFEAKRRAQTVKEQRFVAPAAFRGLDTNDLEEVQFGRYLKAQELRLQRKKAFEKRVAQENADSKKAALKTQADTKEVENEFIKDIKLFTAGFASFAVVKEIFAGVADEIRRVYNEFINLRNATKGGVTAPGNIANPGDYINRSVMLSNKYGVDVASVIEPLRAQIAKDAADKDQATQQQLEESALRTGRVTGQDPRAIAAAQDVIMDTYSNLSVKQSESLVAFFKDYGGLDAGEQPDALARLLPAARSLGLQPEDSAAIEAELQKMGGKNKPMAKGGLKVLDKLREFEQKGILESGQTMEQMFGAIDEWGQNAPESFDQAFGEDSSNAKVFLKYMIRNPKSLQQSRQLATKYLTGSPVDEKIAALQQDEGYRIAENAAKNEQMRKNASAGASRKVVKEAARIDDANAVLHKINEQNYSAWHPQRWSGRILQGLSLGLLPGDASDLSTVHTRLFAPRADFRDPSVNTNWVEDLGRIAQEHPEANFALEDFRFKSETPKGSTFGEKSSQLAAAIAGFRKTNPALAARLQGELTTAKKVFYTGDNVQASVLAGAALNDIGLGGSGPAKSSPSTQPTTRATGNEALDDAATDLKSAAETIDRAMKALLDRLGQPRPPEPQASDPNADVNQ